VHCAECSNVILYRKPCDLKIRVGRGGVNWAENLQCYIAHWFLVPNFTARCLCYIYVNFKKSKKVQIKFFTKSISFRFGF